MGQQADSFAAWGVSRYGGGDETVFIYFGVVESQRAELFDEFFRQQKLIFCTRGGFLVFIRHGVDFYVLGEAVDQGGLIEYRLRVGKKTL